jgi:hypothetical protein
MSTERPDSIPKDWKLFRLANGQRKWLPASANEPLTFSFSPHEALQRGAFATLSKERKKAMRAGRFARR